MCLRSRRVCYKANYSVLNRHHRHFIRGQLCYNVLNLLVSVFNVFLANINLDIEYFHDLEKTTSKYLSGGCFHPALIC